LVVVELPQLDQMMFFLSHLQTEQILFLEALLLLAVVKDRQEVVVETEVLVAVAVD
jgi:hypothetical protein